MVFVFCFLYHARRRSHCVFPFFPDIFFFFFFAVVVHSDLLDLTAPFLFFGKCRAYVYLRAFGMSFPKQPTTPPNPLFHQQSVPFSVRPRSRALEVGLERRLCMFSLPCCQVPNPKGLIRLIRPLPPPPNIATNLYLDPTVLNCVFSPAFLSQNEE